MTSASTRTPTAKAFHPMGCTIACLLCRSRTSRLQSSQQTCPPVVHSVWKSLGRKRVQNASLLCLKLLANSPIRPYIPSCVEHGAQVGRSPTRRPEGQVARRRPKVGERGGRKRNRLDERSRVRSATRSMLRTRALRATGWVSGRGGRKRLELGFLVVP